MDFISHLEELRKRILSLVIVFVVATIFSYCFSSQIVDALIQPLRRYENAQLIFQTPYEAFLTHLRVSALSGLLISSPVLFTHLWRFVSPGLYEKEKKAIAPLICVSVLLAICGASFAYFVVIPLGLHFLLGFQTESLKPLLSIGPYFSFLANLMIIFALVFDFPVVILGLIRLGIIEPEAFARARKLFILIIFVTAALLTPPDPVSQVLMALPLVILFEATLFIAKRTKKKE